MLLAVVFLMQQGVIKMSIEDQLRDKVLEHLEGLDYSEQLEVLGLDIDTLIDGEIERLTIEQMLNII